MHWLSFEINSFNIYECYHIEKYTYSERKFYKESKNDIVSYVGVMVRKKLLVEGEFFHEESSELRVNISFFLFLFLFFFCFLLTSHIKKQNKNKNKTKK